MHEYVLVNVIGESTEEHYKRANLPLHVTLSNTFYSLLAPDQIFRRIAAVHEKYKPFKVRAVSRQLFGEANDVSVTELEKTEVLQNLHLDILAALEDRIEMKKKQFAGKKYRPHVSDQPSGAISVGEYVTIHNLTLLELKDDDAIKLWSVAFG